MIIIKKIIIASHGTLAEGFRNTLELISGPKAELAVMSFYNGEENYEHELQYHFQNLKEDEQLIICTDVQYGSVNQLFIRESIKWKMKNILIVSGINLPLLLEIVTVAGLISRDMLAAMIEKAAKQIVYMDIDKLLLEDKSDDLWS